MTPQKLIVILQPLKEAVAAVEKAALVAVNNFNEDQAAEAARLINTLDDVAMATVDQLQEALNELAPRSLKEETVAPVTPPVVPDGNGTGTGGTHGGGTTEGEGETVSTGEETSSGTPTGADLDATVADQTAANATTGDQSTTN